MAEVATVRAKAGEGRRLVPHKVAGPLLVSPMAFWMLAFFMVPLILIFVYSFGYQGVYDQVVKLTFQNNPAEGQYAVQTFHWYEKVLTTGVYQKAFVTSMIMVVGNTVGCLLLGYPLAYFISRKAGRRKTLFLLLVMLPFWTSFLIRTYAWMSILDDRGLLNNWLMDIGIIDEPMHILFTMQAVVIGLIYDYLPFMVLPLYVSIEKIDRSLFEASKDLGAGKWTTFRRVTLPLSTPGIIAGSMLVAIPTTGEFVIPVILGGGKVSIWGKLIYDAFTRPGQWPLGSAMSNILLAVMMIIVVLYVRAVGTEEF